MADIHQILFNMHIMYSLALGIWACASAARRIPVSGQYLGAVLTYGLLAGAILLLGVLMLLSGWEPRSGRVLVYILYMLWLAILMPGLFSLLQGREERQTMIAFALLAFFNFSTSLSMMQRELVGPWVEAMP